ncbi:MULTISPECIES: dienelactone hydrolase family protein [Methylocaldum]|jgi:putative phosphoribosyl transferase|uniref:dienelactone hydrolase family protein n=1 Tax=unclassified Methylocaldum TaxID=2622260 RepID=UPI00098A2E80|nr:alpha/beta family hydrolase [Methylocaldum sp. 14B]MDV3240453.1 dienelactone hydrolase family protein [Methylocaldum sp.]MVF21316.1 alpha/beta hydrolase [Methylocaldum sp. BRCS4]
MNQAAPSDSIEFPVGPAGVTLSGSLFIPDQPQGLVIFAHGSGSSRFSPRNRAVADFLNRADLATLLFDLLTAEEHEVDQYTRQFRFDIGLLTDRLVGAIDWATQYELTTDLSFGLFGASTGAAAALRAAAERPESVAAVVSRGGRPDLAEERLPEVLAPTLLIVGGYDDVVIELNRLAAERMNAVNRLEIVPGATHLFEEPGTLEKVEELARDWFLKYLRR